jgi:hypothetical protein
VYRHGCTSARHRKFDVVSHTHGDAVLCERGNDRKTMQLPGFHLARHTITRSHVHTFTHSHVHTLTRSHVRTRSPVQSPGISEALSRCMCFKVMVYIRTINMNIKNNVRSGHMYHFGRFLGSKIGTVPPVEQGITFKKR